VSCNIIIIIFNECPLSIKSSGLKKGTLKLTFFISSMMVYYSYTTKEGQKINRFHMLNLVFIILIIVWRIIIMNNPYLLACLFSQVLILFTLFLRTISKYIRLIIFLIYIGGLIILIRYCVILLPITKLIVPIPAIFILVIPLSLSDIRNCYVVGILFRANAVFLICFLLYLVIISVVEIINYSYGILKT